MRQHAGRGARRRGAERHPGRVHGRQAAHESGWGQHEIRNADGTTSHNLFGIKAGAGWKGAVAEVTTTEYVDGEPRKVTGEVPRLRVATRSRSATTRG